MLTLYASARSSASWRVRIALACKGLHAELRPLNLRRDGGQQHQPAFLALNPQGMVPCLVDGDRILTQSIAICEYLEERHPQPALLPSDPVQRAQVRAFVQAIACDIHPLDNLRVLQYLKDPLGLAQEQIDTWYRHWIDTGFSALESGLAQRSARDRCFGAELTLADVFLVPQVGNARRLNMDLGPYPHIVAIDAALACLPAFAQSVPARQPDFS